MSLATTTYSTRSGRDRHTVVGATTKTGLGDGLVSFLWVERDRRLVAKTASVRNVDRFFTFFLRAHLLILVRDGRSVVQSCMSTFGSPPGVIKLSSACRVPIST